MTTDLEHKSNANDSSNIKQSLLGKISIAFGILNVLVSISILWALHSYINQQYVESLFLQVKVINIGGKAELITKPLGLVIGLAGIFEKGKRKATVFYGILINVLVLFWTFAVLSGKVIL